MISLNQDHIRTGRGLSIAIPRSPARDYEKARSAVCICAGMLIDYWRRGDYSPDKSLESMLIELAKDVDEFRAQSERLK